VDVTGSLKKNQLDSLYNICKSSLASYQADYDEITVHGLDYSTQMDYEKSIQRSLDSLNIYSKSNDAKK